MGKSRRVEFGNILKVALGTDKTYFQPGPDFTMEYPCIVYERDDIARMSADNINYRWMQAYQVTLMSKDPDSEVVEKLLALPYSSYSQYFATSGLHHDVFVIYH